MTRFLVIAGLVVALAALISIGWSSKDNTETRPPISSHTTDDHPHTHDGPFAHDHSHVGLEPGVTHSHPHEHRHQHRSDVALDADSWFQIGHQHDSDQTAYYVRCTKIQEEFHLEFMASKATEPAKPIHPTDTFSGEVYISSKSVALVKFRRVDQAFVGKAPDKTSNHPTLSISLSQIPLGGKPHDFIVPVRLPEPPENKTRKPNTDAEILGG